MTPLNVFREVYLKKPRKLGFAQRNGDNLLSKYNKLSKALSHESRSNNSPEKR